jgi:hypothetical protein
MFKKIFKGILENIDADKLMLKALVYMLEKSREFVVEKVSSEKSLIDDKFVESYDYFLARLKEMDAK